MRYALRDYQRLAAVQVLGKLGRARNDRIQYGSLSAFALSAVTAAGKTVIATAVIEAAFYGSSDLDVATDPRAAFLWVTDDPALNRQTRGRMLTASDMLTNGQLRIIDNDFTDATLLPGHVYFLNVQKLSQSASLGKGSNNQREHSMWDVLANTIDDGVTDLYLVLDEAHKGMRPVSDRKTIVRRIIDGQPGTNPSVPVVWGISATIERFSTAMDGTHGRTTYEPVQVDVEKVRASGLVKTQIDLDKPGERGTFGLTLLRAAVVDVLDFDKRWAAYAAAESESLVLPVLVVQVADMVSEAKLAELIDVIESEWPGLPADAVVHVFGEHQDVTVSGREIKWVPPESIQDADDIRVVLAKTAISTGWDCPRAEVLYSQRVAEDATSIAQMIGRMVRAPLAHRITTDDALNSVSCYLPEFNRATLDAIISELTEPGKAGIPPEVVGKTATYPRNPAMDASVFDLIQSLPSVPAPDTLANPLRRARSLVMLLTDDDKGSAMLPDAGASLTSLLNQKLDGLAAQHADKVAENVHDLQHTDVGRESVAAVDGARTGTSNRTLSTHATDIDRDFRIAVAKAKEGTGRAYYAYRMAQGGPDAVVLEIKTQVAALFMVDCVINELEQVATNWVLQQFTDFRVEIDNTVGATRAAFRAVKEQSSEPEEDTVDLGDNQRVPFRDAAGELLRTFDGHLFCDDQGKFPAKLQNDWETTVVETELARPSFVAWYRNPGQPKPSALRIAYKDDAGVWRSLQVDFIVISKRGDGSLAASLVDPHGDYLADAKAKLLALANFAEQHGDTFLRVESIAKSTTGTLRSLNLTEPRVRQAVRGFAGGKVSGLYESDAAHDYK